MRIAALALCFSLSLSLAARAEPVPAPAVPAKEEQRHSSAPKVALVTSGLIVTGASYGASVGTAAVYGLLVVPFLAAFHERIPTDPLYLLIPVAGPLLIIHNDRVDRGTRTLLYLDAAAQVLGFGMLFSGFAVAPANRPSVRLTFVPGGAGLLGRF
jgi:hypothetical protein